MRILGLDVGSKRIGVALSDGLGLTAQGLDTIRSKGRKNDIESVCGLVKNHQVSEIVVGVPLSMDGTDSAQTGRVREFAEQLESRVDVPVVMWDERLSSVAAERALLEADMSREKRKKVIDKVAAMIILQSYLDYQCARSGYES